MKNTTGEKNGAVVTGTCVAVDNETGEACGQEGNLRRVESFSLPFCPAHRTGFYTYTQHIAAAVVHRLDRDEVLWGESPGHTYVVLLNDGNVKIGKTTVTLISRLTDVSREYNEGEPVKILAVLKGGESTELLTHGKFKHLRIATREGERFRPEPELLNWAAEQGITHSASEQVKQYEEWRQMKLKEKENLAAIKRVATSVGLEPRTSQPGANAPSVSRATVNLFDDDDWN